MRTAANKTLLIFSFYPMFAGISMVLAPAMQLQSMNDLTGANLPIEGLNWIRMLGVVTFIIGYYYFRMSWKHAVDFARFTVHMRLLVPAAVAAMIVVFDMPFIYLPFTALDVAGALWTWSALHRMGVPVWSSYTSTV